MRSVRRGVRAAGLLVLASAVAGCGAPQLTGPDAVSREELTERLDAAYDGSARFPDGVVCQVAVRKDRPVVFLQANVGEEDPVAAGVRIRTDVAATLDVPPWQVEVELIDLTCGAG